jgi:hypothetical protein
LDLRLPSGRHLAHRHQFGAGDASPLLTPLVTVSTAALLAVYNLGTDQASKMPHRLDEQIALSGVATTALVCLVEFLVLRQHGERLLTEAAETLYGGRLREVASTAPLWR